MDVNDLRIATTLISFALFIGIMQSCPSIKTKA
jgi:hypothetical protein